MKAFASIVGGVCVYDDGLQRHVVNVVDMSPVASETAHLVCGAIDDWEAIEFSNRENLIREIGQRHRLTRGLANIEVCLTGVSASLTRELFGEIEDLLKAQDAHDDLAAMLLRAPLASLDGLIALIKECLSAGFASTASLLEQVRESQPQLRRLTDRWLSISNDLLADWPGGRQQFWRMAVASKVVLETLNAQSVQSVENAWVKLAFDRPSSPRQKAAISRVSKAVARMLYPEQTESFTEELTIPEDYRDQIRHAQPKGQAARESHERALRQVDAIVSAVAEGHDAKARRFLRDLVDGHLTQIGGEEYAVKSLCNIAQKCAEMFRTDFEFECLQDAINVKPGDAWTRIQMADHLKRVGRFDDAIARLHEAEALGEERVAKSSLADVCVQRGQFQEAIEIYESIPEAEQDKTIRQAKADVLRRWGYLEEANLEYDRIIQDGLATDRVYAGKAEIAKRKGQLSDARKLYQELLENNDLDGPSAVIYQLSLANVLVRMGELADAYEQLDRTVQQRPFSRQARAFRAAVAGLLGNPNEAIGDLPQLGQTQAFNEWVSNYVRGLLLLMLDRFADARELLLQNVEKQLLDNDAHGMLQLGAAVCFLKTKSDIQEASERLDKVPAMKDAFADAIHAALRYHVAVSLRRDAEIAKLKSQLASVDDEDLKTLVTAISQRDWKNAWILEVRMLLRLAV